MLKITEPMRTKETAHDYRYFPEPDLVPIVVSDEWLNRVEIGDAELPRQRFNRFMREYELSEHEPRLLTATPHSRLL